MQIIQSRRKEKERKIADEVFIVASTMFDIQLPPLYWNGGACIAQCEQIKPK